MYHTNFWEVNDEQTEFIFSYPENYMTGSVWFKQMGYLCVAIFGIYVWQRLFNNFNQLTYRGVSSISTGDKELAYVFERMNEPESKKTIYGYDVPDVAGACINKPDTASISVAYDTYVTEAKEVHGRALKVYPSGDEETALFGFR